jgi:short-subunit dehydrogenase
MRVEGKVVLITGASEGIGAACAELFRRRGARLSLTARSREKLEAVGGPEALLTPGDLTDPAVRRLVFQRTLERFSAIDILINNAGAGLYGPSWRPPLDSARRLFELNFFAALEMIQLVVPLMRRRKSGMIVNVSSIAGKVTFPWMTLYCAGKYALNSLSEGLRMELAASGIRVLTVCPGHVLTGFTAHALEGRPPEAVSRGRWAAITAEQCARAILRGVEREARTVVVPRVGWLLVALARLAPRLLEGPMIRLAGPPPPEEDAP